MRIPVEPRAMSLPQRFGNWLATRLIWIFWGHRYGDLGPMRAMRWNVLNELGMRDTDYGWTVEMQIKALQKGLRVRELPIPYLRRKAGHSKVSGTLVGSFRAGLKILWVISQGIWEDRGFSRKQLTDPIKESGNGGHSLPAWMLRGADPSIPPADNRRSR
jgi:hypothetical protein